MKNRHTEGWSRREFLGVTLAGAAGLVGLKPEPLAAEPPPETTTLKIVQSPGDLCLAPQYVAEQFLRDEGFTEVQYVKKGGYRESQIAVASGEAYLNMYYVPDATLRMDAGDPIVVLGGGHIGSFDLFGSNQVHTLRELKGQTVAVPNLQTGPITFIAGVTAYVDLDPQKDINRAKPPPTESTQRLVDGKIDMFMVYPPERQGLQAKHIGHVLVSAMRDRPWSQYFCCMVIGNLEFVRKHPVATKRALRAILKAADVCTREPERAARLLIEKGYATSYDHILQMLNEIPYGKWRESSPEDTVRFYALHLHESGMIKSNPQKSIVEGTDWRFWNELKKELTSV